MQPHAGPPPSSAATSQIWQRTAPSRSFQNHGSPRSSSWYSESSPSSCSSTSLSVTCTLRPVCLRGVPFRRVRCISRNEMRLYLLSPSTSVRGELKTNVACGTVGRCDAAFTAWGATVITPTMPPAGPFGAARPLVPLQRHPIVHRERFGTVPALAVSMSSRSGRCLWKRPAHQFVPLPRYVVVSSEYFATMTAVRHHLQMGACGTPA